MMTDLKTLLRSLHTIELKTGILVEGLAAGEHRSLFKGQGIEFSEIREYVPGDDVRTIDWKVTARLNKPYIKDFSEERDQRYYFLIDGSASGSFGSDVSKAQRILEVTASLMFAAQKQHELIGLCIFTDRIEQYIPARRGRRHLIALLNTLIAYTPHPGGTDLAAVLKQFTPLLKRQSSVIVISDFFTEDPARALSLLRLHHEVSAIRVTDPREHDLPDCGLMMFEDEESGEQLLVDTSDPAIRERYRLATEAATSTFTEMCRRCRVGQVDLTTEEPYDIPLKRLFCGRRAGTAGGR
jgi:uncharacterized protein (DUF58 family)